MAHEGAPVQFSDTWPQLAARLRGVLRARRVPADLVDDLVQETGLRLYRKWDGIDQHTVWPLAKTVLQNLVVDEMRKQDVRRRHVAVEGGPASVDFDQEILSRLELRRVEKALRDLSPVDQRVLLAEWGEATELSFSSTAALKMARMRARQRLRAALDRASGWVPMWRLRRILTEKTASMGTIAEQLSRVAVAAVVVVTASGGVPGPDAGTAARPSPGWLGSPGLMQMSASSLSGLAGHALDRTDRVTTRSVGGSRAVTTSGSRTTGAEELNENFGPVRTGDNGSLHIGEGGNGLGPYGVDQGVETSAPGQPTTARVRARYEAPKCDGEIHVGRPSTHRCDGPGNGSAGAEGGTGQHHYGVETPPGP